MTASTPNLEKKDHKRYEEIGLLERHSYTILDIQTITNKNFEKVVIFKLRNPWGHHEWQGDYSDQSPCWTFKQKEKMDIIN